MENVARESNCKEITAETRILAVAEVFVIYSRERREDRKDRLRGPLRRKNVSQAFAMDKQYMSAFSFEGRQQL